MSTDVVAQAAAFKALASGATSVIPITQGGTGATTASAARTALGLGTIATQGAGAVAVTGGSITGITDLAVADGGTGASSASAARTNLGLGAIATQDPTSVAITGGSIAGITDLAIADGGTGASTAAGARTNLGLGTLATLSAVDGLSTASGSAPSYSLRAFVSFNGTGTVAIRAGANVTSITDNGTGDYTINFTTAMPDANFVTLGTSNLETAGDYIYSVEVANGWTPVASSVQVNVKRTNNGGNLVAADASIVNIGIVR